MSSPRLLFRILLVISIVFSATAALSYLFVGAMQPTLAAYYADHSDLFPSEVYAALERLFDAPRAFFLATAAAYLLEVAGAVLMWFLRFAGFHCYAIARLVLILLPPLFLGSGFLAVGDIMFALLFIVVYYLLLRRLKADDEPPQEDPQEA